MANLGVFGGFLFELIRQVNQIASRGSSICAGITFIIHVAFVSLRIADRP